MFNLNSTLIPQGTAPTAAKSGFLSKCHGSQCFLTFLPTCCFFLPCILFLSVCLSWRTSILSSKHCSHILRDKYMILFSLLCSFLTLTLLIEGNFGVRDFLLTLLVILAILHLSMFLAPSRPGAPRSQCWCHLYFSSQVAPTVLNT